MTRLHHLMICTGMVVALAACDRPPASPNRSTPTAPDSKPAAAAKPAAPRVVRVAPEWSSRLPVVELKELGTTLGQADEALVRGQLERGTSPGPGALELYLAVLALQPENVRAQAGVQSVLDALLERGRLAMRLGKLGDAERIELIVVSLLPEHPDLAIFQQHLGDARRAEAWVTKANGAGKAGRVTSPEGRSVQAYLAKAEAAFADFAPVREARTHWNAALLARAWRSAKSEKFDEAEALLEQSAVLDPKSVDARVMELQIVEFRQARTVELLARGNHAVDKLRLKEASRWLQHASAIAAQRAGIDALGHRIHLARHYGPFKPRQVFAERLRVAGSGPEMVIVPYGNFMMGSPDDETGHQDSEAPAHRVTFGRGFAIARNETTVAEFRRFVEATRYRTLATRAGQSTVYDEKGGVFSEHAGVDWRRDHVGRVASPALPVVHVAVQDALAYARWLSAQTGHRYRLPSEAEFEYVLRAGSKKMYPWGGAPPRQVVGNLPGDGDLSQSGRRWGNPVPDYRDAFWGPAPVRNFPGEPFGTFDMIGNVSEWTLDCWHESYQRAPMDGSAWVNPGCPQRVVRGASWGSSLDQARSASRLPMDADTSTARLGFRVVREI